MIAPDTITRVRERTDIVALIGETVRLTRRGASFVGLCPFHKEKSPSFYVHPARGFFHCFGCQESGDAFKFVMRMNGLDFREAAAMLAERAGVPIDEARPGDVTRARAQRSEKDELYAVNQLAATYFESQLGFAPAPAAAGHPIAHHARAEIVRRGMPEVTDAASRESEDARRWLDVLQAFRVGYAPPGWDGLASFLQQQGISPNIAARAGLLVERQGSGRGHYDRFRHRLMFAVVDSLGRVVAFSGRALTPPTPQELASLGSGAPSYDGEAPAKYINSPESPIYTKGEHLFGIHQARQGIRTRGEALLVEGNFDVVSLHARGIDHAVAPLGTAFTTEQAKLLKRFGPRVVILFDGDAAGRKATRSARVACREGGLEARVALVPRGLDPDELVKREGPAVLLEIIKGARGLLEHLIDEALEGEGFGGATLTERVARIRAVAKLLSEEDDPNMRLMAKLYADKLSNKLLVDGRAPEDLFQLERMLQQAVAQPHPGPASRQVAPSQPPNRAAVVGPQGGQPPSRDGGVTALGREILGALIDCPDLLQDAHVTDALSVLEGDVALAVVAVRQRLTNDDPEGGTTGLGPSQVADFLAALPLSIHSFASGRLASPIFEEVSEAKTELLDNAHKMRLLSFKREKAAAHDVLQRSPASLDPEIEALLRAAQERARKKSGVSD